VLGQLIAFLGVSVVVICTPGPDTALTVRNALAGGRAGPAAGPPAVPSLRLTPARSLRQGVINDLANPKMAAFFLSPLPQFASAGRGAPRVLALGLLFCLLTFAWLAVYSVVVARMRRVLGAPRVRRALEALAGSVLVAFGVHLAFEER
jgi:threonine/homoserine/homoserine lactone efflux protein